MCSWQSAGSPLPPSRNAPLPIKAFCIDFNWGPKGINGFAGPGVWADASPEEHVRWYEGLGANVIQTFAVSCNGYAWYKGGIIPPQPGLKFDFLTDLVRLGHAKGMRVMGYYCVGANTLWGQKHPDLSYGTPSAPHIPLTTAYLDYLCGSMEDALKRTGMDGFMIDWVWNPSQRILSPGEKAREQWLECEKAMYRELMSQPFPGEDRLKPSDKLAYERRALDRCWTRIHAAAKRANSNCVIWLSCNDLKHPTVIDSKMFREIDWLMNEHPDPASIAAVAKMAGPHTQLVQCLVGWGDQHDAKKVLENPEFRKLGIYGFAKPGENSLPLPISQYRSQAPKAFKANDKNIAVLLRYFHGLPLDRVAEPQHPGTQSKMAPNPDTVSSDNCFLFSYFVGNGEDGLHLASSNDGYHWQALNGGKSFLVPQAGKSRLMRDPCLLRGPDGVFRLVWTNGWNDQTIGYASSKDLLHWSEQQAIGVMAHEPQAMNCWAPEVVFDEAKQQYVIFWSTTIPGRFPQTDGTGDGKYNHRIYSTTTKDFKTFTPTRLFFDGGFNVIDATMLHANGKYYLIVKDETLKPVKKNLRIAVGDSPDGPFGAASAPFTPSWVEGPTAIRIGDDYVVYFDCYTKGCYGAVRSRNLKDWEDVTSRLTFPKGARHGTVLQVPKSVADRLSEAR